MATAPLVEDCEVCAEVEAARADQFLRGLFCGVVITLLAIAIVTGCIVAGVRAEGARMPYQYPTPPGTMVAGQHGSDDLTGKPKVVRLYFQWGEDAKEDAAIKAAHAKGQIPWVSFKPPADGVAAIRSGKYDTALSRRGQRYRSYAQPVLATFFHEPVGDLQPGAFWETFNYIRVKMGAGSRGGMGATTFTPILNGYIYADWYRPVGNPRGDLDAWVDPGVNLRVFGFDNYDTVPGLRRMLDDVRGILKPDGHIAIAEFGRVNPPEGTDQGGATGFREKLALFREYAGYLNVVCYFNSRVQVLEEGSPELADWREFLAEFD